MLSFNEFEKLAAGLSSNGIVNTSSIMPRPAPAMKVQMPKPPTTSITTSSYANAGTSPMMSMKPMSMPKIASMGAVSTALIAKTLLSPTQSAKRPEGHSDVRITSRDPEVSKLLESSKVKEHIKDLVH